MNILRFLGRRKSASAARERLQVLLAHERASMGGSDLVEVLRKEIMAVLSKHVKVEGRPGQSGENFGDMSVKF